MHQSRVLEQCTRDNGSIDWNKVAKMTRYAVSVEVAPPKLEESLTPEVQEVIMMDKLPETVAVHKT